MIDKILIVFGDAPFTHVKIAGKPPYKTSVHCCCICGAMVAADNRDKHIRFHERLGFTFTGD